MFSLKILEHQTQNLLICKNFKEESTVHTVIKRTEGIKCFDFSNFHVVIQKLYNDSYLDFETVKNY